jgi:nucleotide-binding universal stress UspA family protein
MMRIRQILHPTDFSSCAHAAFEHALFLARKHGSVVDVFHVSPTFGEDPIRGAFESAIDEQAFYKALWEKADREMRAYLEAHDTSGVTIKRIHTRGPSVKEVILEYAVSEDVDLIVLGTHGRHGVRRVLLGSVAETVVREAPCPVFTVHAKEKEGMADVRKVRHILAPFDFSYHSREALRYAKELAALYEAHLDLLHVIQQTTYPDFYNAASLSSEVPDRDLEAEARREMEKVYELTLGPNGSASFHAVTGNPAFEILAFAERRPSDMIVMATHGQTGVQQFFTGSVTERVVRSAPCPVFTVRSFGKSLFFRQASDEEAQVEKQPSKLHP